jgi:hypothetical protein
VELNWRGRENDAAGAGGESFPGSWTDDANLARKARAARGNRLSSERVALCFQASHKGSSPLIQQQEKAWLWRRADANSLLLFLVPEHFQRLYLSSSLFPGPFFGQDRGSICRIRDAVVLGGDRNRVCRTGNDAEWESVRK